MKRRSLIRHLEQNDCYQFREGGNHSIWRNDATGQRPSVPSHNEIMDILVKKICRDLGIPSPN